MRKLRCAMLALTLSLLCFVAFAPTAWALSTLPDMSHTEEIDSFTGLPTTAEESLKNNNKIKISTDVDYDSELGKFMIYQSRSQETYIISNITPSMQVTQPVSFSGDLTKICQLLVDGEPLQGVDLQEIKEPGNYVLAIGDPKVPGTVTVPFTILRPITNKLELFSPPLGFYITEATFNGEATDFTMDYLSMAIDGNYSVRYRSIATGLSYVLEILVDHTPPTLTLAGVKDGVSAGEVTISGIKPGDNVVILCDDVQIKYEDKLVQQGKYQITITDEAGNVNTYQFVIPVYFNRNSLVFFGMLLLGLGILIAYLWRAKTHLRVR